MARRAHQDQGYESGGHRRRSRWRHDPIYATWTVGIGVAIVAAIAIPVGLTTLEDRTSPSQTVRLATCGGCTGDEAGPIGSAPSSSVGAPVSETRGPGSPATATGTSSASATPSGHGTAPAHPKGSPTAPGPTATASGGAGGTGGAGGSGGNGGGNGNGNGGAVSAPPSSAPPAPSEAVVTVEVDSYSGGYTGNIIIQANQGYGFPHWSLQLQMPGSSISFAWDADVSSHQGQVSASGWQGNDDIPTGGSATFGFQADGSATSPSGCVINGAPCTVVFDD